LVAGAGHPDLFWLDPPLRIEAVRELQHDLALSPTEGRRRIAVLPAIEEASLGAANSLLKTLEEPPRRVIIVLTTAAPQDVLPTIRSRCRLVPLRALTVPAVAAALTERWDVPAERAALLARLSGGRLGWAVGALEDEAVLEGRDAWLDDLQRALSADRATRIDLAGTLAAGDGAATGLAVWTSWWRDLLLAQQGLDEAVVNLDRRDDLRAAARRYGPEQVTGALRALEDALRRLAANTNPRLAFEVLLLELPS
jgi:DNA polymerase-3 subunit delta'